MKGQIYEFLKQNLANGVPTTGFEGTVFGYPLHYAISGNRYPEAEAVAQALDRIRDQEGGYHLDRAEGEKIQDLHLRNGVSKAGSVRRGR